MSNAKGCKSFFDLPLHDIFGDIAKYLDSADLFNFRKCSKFCEELGDSALAARTTLIIDGWDLMSSRVVFESCRRLEEIEIANVDWLTDALIEQLLMNNRRMWSLYVTNCKNVSTTWNTDLQLNDHETTLQVVTDFFFAIYE